MSDEPDAAERNDDRPDGEGEHPAIPGPAVGQPVCDVCGAPMYERHCRIICPRCGYQRDCSDP